MTAQDYPVTFGYKAQDGYYYGPKGTVGLYHRGNDRAMPVGTPIVIGNTTIGLSGNTGLSGGPHLHIQAMKGSDVNPTPYEFKPGVVQEAGYVPDFGNYIAVLVDGVKVYYAHLSKINVTKGQKLSASTQGGSEVFNNDKEVQEAYQLIRGNAGSAAERKDWVGKPKQKFIQLGKKETDATRTALVNTQKQLADVKAALANEQKKPPKEVVKIVEKIVEKPVEVVVEGTKWETLKQLIRELVGK